ncbi:bifunctional phosphopantothenoylcysteine decarboxylase/phosphopantothenate--cysteine ligase CoaBC [Thiotrichales bacterium 19S3-7]|nr:bifunctional phosphopantothenoylcysteine decarboxylase/phosphopantothenate--cysteine ligase CoaBC [Thiotrichales bacterium 19S3-7]MCF6802968.1 bifunctional phosphopantothenoylcysteine decarboxylase/phosphopantothenate--cysteine ligase CoaBC [Thiotrichales bacterium 19S3-11]
MNIVLGVTGGIAAYKSVELARLLVKSGSTVKVVMTETAKKFIHPNTFHAVTGYKVYDSCYEDDFNPMAHIELAKWANQIIIAPATANFIAKIACGLCDELLSTILLATEAKVAIAPAMNKVMWHKQITQENIKKLHQLGYEIIKPEAGVQACGDVGVGRMAEPEVIFQLLNDKHKASQIIPELVGKKFIITAGPTQEAIDPVRYISNHSSGKMGYAIADVLTKAGANVVLITGPTTLVDPGVTKFIKVKTAEQMYCAVFENMDQCDVFIGAAAVSDYRIKDISEQKIKKQANKDSLKIELTKNVDILASVGHLDKATRPKVVGFAAETEHLLTYAQEKLINKNLDMIVANEVKVTGEPFHSDYNQVSIISSNGRIYQFESETKNKLAHRIINLIVEICFNHSDIQCSKKSTEHQECLDLAKVF